MKNVVLASLLFAVVTSCTQSQNITNLDAHRFEKQLHETNEKIILDVRTPEEYNAGHIPGAILINYYASDFSSRIMQLDKSKPVYVYCAAGSRSSAAAKKLAQSGFVSIYNLQGGFNAWKKSGKPIK